MNPVLEKLLEGNRRHYDPTQVEFEEEELLRKKLATEGQHPKAIILTCSDSRACPESLFDAKSGELFVVRVAGNVLNSEVLGSIEYAVHHLGSSLVMVLGHTQCGAVKAAHQSLRSKEPQSSPHLEKLLSDIRIHIPPNASEEDLQQTIRVHTLEVAQDLIKESNILHEAVEKGSLEIIAGIHNLMNGKVEIL